VYLYGVGSKEREERVEGDGTLILFFTWKLEVRRAWEKA
jgi:hypothetical protein